MIETYDQAVEYLDSHVGLGVKPGLDRIRELLDLMGRPQDSMAMVHVTGTNGKTTVARIITSILTAHGLKVGTFTSPHLERIEERFAIASEMASREAFAEAIADVAPFVDLLERRTGERATYFELSAAGAFAFFATNAVDIAVIEVGLGGRLDATNVADAQVAVLTSVAIDHTEYLGNTIELIAAEKLAIVKPEATLITGDIPEVVTDMAAKRAGDVGADWRALDRDFSVVEDFADVGGHLVDVQGVHEKYSGIALPLHGRHQVDNLAVAIAAAEEIFGRSLSEDAVREGVAEVRSPGRIEVISRDPLVLVDGAHNEQAMRALAETVVEEFGDYRWNLVIGILDDKDVTGMLAHLDGLIGTAIVTAADSPRATDPEALAESVRTVLTESDEVLVVPDVGQAVAEALAITERGGALLVTGSLYVIGEARPVLMSLT